VLSLAAEMPPKTRKIAIMGYRAVGKSTITVQFCQNQFSEEYLPTIENSFHKVIKFKGEEFNTEIIDTTGQDEYSLFPQKYSIGIHGYILVYSVINRASFDTIKLINEKILNAIGATKVPRILVGNKTDLDGERQISTEEGRALSQEWGCGFVECSAKLNDKIGEMFLILLSEIDKSENPNKKDDTCTIL